MDNGLAISTSDLFYELDNLFFLANNLIPQFMPQINSKFHVFTNVVTIAFLKYILNNTTNQYVFNTCMGILVLLNLLLVIVCY